MSAHFLTEKTGGTRRFRTLSVIIIAVLMMTAVCSPYSVAQEKKEATQKEIDVKNASKTQSPDTPLPKIDLPEFVITGSEEINLDITNKAEDDEDRIFMPQKPVPGFRSLEVDGAVSRKQIKQFSKAPAGLNGKVFAGLGFYLTPQMDGWFGQHDDKNSFMINGYYSSTEGHVDDAGWWKAGFGAKGRYVMPDSSDILPYAQLSGDLRYGRESYRAYASAAPTQVRDLSAFDISLGAGSRYALPYKSLSGFDYTGRIGIGTFSASDSVASSETDFYLNGVATTRFLALALRGQAEYRTTAYTMSVPGISAGHWFVIKGEGQTLILPSLQLSVALQQFIYRGNAGAAGGRFYPQAEVRYFMTERATMYAGFAPTVERNTLSSLTQQNRYIHYASRLMPSDVPVSVLAGFEFTPAEEITASAKFTYRHVNNFATFLDTSGAKVWEVTYLSEVRSSRVDLSLLYRFNPRQNVTAYFTTQSVTQKDSARAMPYIPKYSVGAVYHHFFDMGLHLEALAEFVSSRFTDFSNTHSNAGYVFTSVKGDIEVLDRFRATAELHNAINQRYFVWNGYQERNLYLLLGISYSW
ncbi:MAG: TonB-dependent receptor [Bacteroidota bacterium]